MTLIQGKYLQRQCSAGIILHRQRSSRSTMFKIELRGAVVVTDQSIGSGGGGGGN